MSDYKYSVKNTTRVEREKLRNIALSYAILDAVPPSEATMELVDQYVAGKTEIADILKLTIERYKVLGAKDA